MSNMPYEGSSDPTEAILEAVLGPRTSGMRNQLRQNALARGNTPSAGIGHKMMHHYGQPAPPGSLWIVDRILQPQAVAHFLEVAMSGTLPGGTKTTVPEAGLLKFEEVAYLTSPPSEWALAPFNNKQIPYIQDIMCRIGSLEDSARLQPISKDLHFLKSRIWEGIMPVS